MAYTFSKDERLCSRSLIDRLYAEGHRLMAFPFSVQWMPLPSPNCQVMFVVPKRKFRHAVDRNRVKRLSRECWRTRKEALYAFLGDQGTGLALSLVYIHTGIMSYDQLGHKMDKLVAQLEKDIQSKL